MKLKIWLWRIGILKNCPLCGSEMSQIGHKKLWTRYKCTKCNFGKMPNHDINEDLCEIGLKSYIAR